MNTIRCGVFFETEDLVVPESIMDTIRKDDYANLIEFAYFGKAGMVWNHNIQTTRESTLDVITRVLREKKIPYYRY